MHDCPPRLHVLYSHGYLRKRQYDGIQRLLTVLFQRLLVLGEGGFRIETSGVDLT